MPNLLGLAGAQAQKTTRYACIYNPRWSSGLWTNRSPLRDATTTRIVEKFYGSAGDALIAGLNTEISEKLTLIRRPGNSVFGTDTWNSVDRFYDFRLFNAATEEITLMVDEANGLYSLNAPQNSAKTLVWTKSNGAGQTYMQSVGNTLYFGNGVDNKKWLQTLFKWTANTQLNTPSTPYLTTFFIDPNGNIQQFTATSLPISWVYVNADTVQVNTAFNITGILTVGQTVTFPSKMVATFLEGQTVTITALGNTSFFFNFIHANYPQTNEGAGTYAVVDPGDGTPTTGASQPVWSVTVPSAANDFQGGLTQDGSVQWTNRGNPVENWGIAMPTAAVSPVVDGGDTVWKNSTFYSLVSCVVDTNGNLQQVVRAGLSQTPGPPNWSKVLGGETLDGIPATGVIWKMVASAAMMGWQPNTFYPAGSFLLETASGTQCLFKSSPPTAPYLTGSVSAYLWVHPHSGGVGTWDGVDPYNTGNPTNPPSGLPYPTNPGSANVGQATGLTGFDFAIDGTGTGGSFVWNTINSAGAVTGTTNPFPGVDVSDLYIVVAGTLEVPVAGNYVFVLSHGDGLQWGIGGGATLVSGTPPVNLSGTNTAINGYPVLPAGTNENVTMNSGNQWVDTYTINFPTAGTYPIEINMARWDKPNAGLSLTVAGHTLPSGQPTGGATSGSVEPTWPAWTTADAPAYPEVTESSGRLQWNNIGPSADYTWAAAQNFTLPNTNIVDSNNNIEAPYRSGYTADTGGAPSWSIVLDGLTDDNPNLIWINLGPSTAPPVGSLTTVDGWKYALSLVNTLDDTVSNATNLSALVGPFTDATGVTFAPGQGLPALSKIDPQADFVAIWRTTDGENQAFLIPSTDTDYDAPVTISLHDYLLNGYTDTTPDENLDNLISAPVLGENTPPAAGAVNLTYYLNRIFYSIGATAYWTSGPSTPAGNGLNGSSPLNYDEQSALVSRLVPTTSGLFVLTVSDINIIQGNGSSTPILPAVPLLEGIGLLSYNALDVNGSIIGMFTTDHQFVIIDPSSGISSAGYPLGDQFRLNNGQVGQSWNPADVYVAWYVNGEDQGWYVCDGVQGWFRLMATPAPETGSYTWAPFAQIVPGVKALQSLEVTPGNHQLLLGPTGVGNILYRNLGTNVDGTTPYLAYAVLGSCVLAQPGQYAVVPFITTESVGTGIPLVLGILVDEALPYYQGPFEVLKKWDNDPPNLVPSISIPAQRFYLSDDGNTVAAMRHLQIMVSWAAQNVPSELLSLSIFGGFIQE